jgi:hypothetical protein
MKVQDMGPSSWSKENLQQKVSGEILGYTAGHFTQLILV